MEGEKFNENNVRSLEHVAILMERKTIFHSLNLQQNTKRILPLSHHHRPGDKLKIELRSKIEDNFSTACIVPNGFIIYLLIAT